MIHYHGTPMGSRRCAAAVLSGRHALISHAHPDHIDVAAAVCQSFVLDNGAFSHFKGGKAKTDWAAYYEWAERWLSDPSCDWALIPDAIGGTDEDNDRLLAEWPLGRDRGVPVYHLHEAPERLTRLASEYPRVALGSSGDYWQVGSSAWWQRMSQMMTAVCDDAGRPRCRLHGLRMLDWRIFSLLPLASADSVNVGMNHHRTRKLYDIDPEAGAEVIASRIEAHTGAAFWHPSNVPDVAQQRIDGVA